LSPKWPIMCRVGR